MNPALKKNEYGFDKTQNTREKKLIRLSRKIYPDQTIIKKNESDSQKITWYETSPEKKPDPEQTLRKYRAGSNRSGKFGPDWIYSNFGE